MATQLTDSRRNRRVLLLLVGGVAALYVLSVVGVLVLNP